jgi:hypothetical protein
VAHIEGTLGSSYQILVVVVWLFWLIPPFTHLAILLHNQNLALILSAI